MDEINVRRPLSAIVADMRALLDELVAQIPTLQPLVLSEVTGKVGTAVVIAITGATAGSVITGVVPDGLTLNSAERTITGTPAVAGAYQFTLVETLAGATNNPNPTDVELDIEAAPSGLWNWSDRSITFDQAAVGFNGATGGGPSPGLTQIFGFGSRTGQPAEENAVRQIFGWGFRVGQPAEETTAVQRFGFGSRIGQPAEESLLIQQFGFGARIGAPKEGN